MIGNPMQAFCGAHCRTTGQPCKNHPMPNGRCRMHGGKSTGRPVTTGHHTQDAIQDRRKVQALLGEIRELMQHLKE